jgi:hypothetical protein
VAEDHVRPAVNTINTPNTPHYAAPGQQNVPDRHTIPGLGDFFRCEACNTDHAIHGRCLAGEAASDPEGEAELAAMMEEEEGWNEDIEILRQRQEERDRDALEPPLYDDPWYDLDYYEWRSRRNRGNGPTHRHGSPKSEYSGSSC